MSQAFWPVPVTALPRASDRATFLYLEHCVVHRQDGAITAQNEKGIIKVPAASLLAVMLGPGTSVSHQAMLLLGECGTTVVWVGENGVRYYAHGRPLATSSSLLERQSKIVASPQRRLKSARLMYSMRFKGEDVTGLTMQQLRGREGSRMKKLYKEYSQKTGVAWDKREYNPNDFFGSDPINQALSAAHAALYGVVHAVVVSLGCSPGLGIIHKGLARSFVFDIADLYKAEISVPIAFDVAASNLTDIPGSTRRMVRDEIYVRRLVPKIVQDIYRVLDYEEAKIPDSNILSLWDYQQNYVAGGVNYGTQEA